MKEINATHQTRELSRTSTSVNTKVHAQHSRKALIIGARLFNMHAAEGFGALELGRRLWSEASQAGLTGSLEEIWRGYISRSVDVSKNSKDQQAA